MAHLASFLYEAPGTSIDWAYSIGVDFPVALEMRPGIGFGFSNSDKWFHDTDKPYVNASNVNEG